MGKLSRRLVLSSGLSFGIMPLLPPAAYALTDANARILVDKVVADINAVIASGKPVNTMIRDFEGIFSRYADVPLIAQRTLGPVARTISNSQRRNYTAAFKSYVARKYGKQFRRFIGGEIKVRGVRKVKSWQEVKATVFLSGEAPTQVLFLVSDRSGKDLFFDMIIEGVSLTIFEKDVIGGMLDKRKGNIEALITDLNKAG